MMKRLFFHLSIFTALILALVAFPAWRAAADDETDEVEIKVQAPLDAIDCSSTPPTITVLGLTIDISNIGISGNDDVDCDDDNEDNDGEDSGNLTCAELEQSLGQIVEVKLASDVPDETTKLLSATEVEVERGGCEDNDCDEVEITAPIQGVVEGDPLKIKVLGLEVDISSANLEGCDDEDSEENNQPIDPSQLVEGQFVEMTLASSQVPLVATEVEVKNISNEVDGEVVDEDGHDVDDDVEDVEVNVHVTTRVKASPGAAVRREKKVVSFHTVSNGRFTLAGLPTGRAKIVVTRVNNGQTSSAVRTVKITGNRTKYLRMRLKPVH